MWMALCAAHAERATRGAAEDIIDPVYVYYERGSCREESIELEVWDREAGVWVDHPRHPEVPVESCQLEDAGILFQEIRRRCVERRPTELPAAWVVGLNVFDPNVMERCAVDAPVAHDGVEIRISRPGPGEAVRSPESRVTIEGDVLVGGATGARYDVVLALDVSQATGTSPASGGRPARPDLFGAQIDAALDLVSRLRTRLGAVRVGVVTFPNTVLSKNALGGTGARRETKLTDDAREIDRVLRNLRSRRPASFQSFSSGFPFAVRELLGENPGSGARPNARKVLIVSADGRSDVPFGPAEALTRRFLDRVEEGTGAAARAGIEAHFFALGGVAGDTPAYLAPVVGEEGSFRRIPEPRLGSGFLQLVSLPYVTEVRVTDLRTGEPAGDLALRADGSFRASVPVVGGRNPVLVTAVTSEGLRGRRELIVDFDDSLIREALREAERERIEALRREGKVEVRPEDERAR